MAEFQDHINQTKKNINFLQEINSVLLAWDWKVTVTFYSAVHLVNAHLAQFNLHYRSHKDTENALSPFNDLSLSKTSEEIYSAYKSLNNLSRRSRYLCHDSRKNHSDACHLTHDKHYAKAIKKLDILLSYFSEKYKFEIKPIEITCIDLKESDKLKYFKLLKAVA